VDMPSGPITVVSNTSSLRYLTAAGRPDLVQKIFAHILIPRGVEGELVHPSAPAATRQWMATERGIVVVGILGILIASCRRGHLQNPAEILEQLRKVGFRVSRRLIIEFEKQILIAAQSRKES